MTTIDVISLGCSKNLVDSERIMFQLQEAGYKVTHNAKQPRGEIVVVNTCGFIGDAKEESINTILECCEAKKTGRVRKVIVMGCLSERYLADLEEAIPEVDKYYGKFNWNELVADLKKESEQPVQTPQRVITTPSHYAYLKISEGCDRHCAYCAIPIITGKHVSRSIDDIEAEVRWLASQGVKELQVIAQELTYYGIDLYGSRQIVSLIQRITAVPGIEWVRLHYAYPTQFPVELLREMRENPKVCRYLDIALQHISTPILERMHRHVTAEKTRELISQIRREVPGIRLRTTMMVGFPGETEEQFQELMDFVREARFERLGAFAYSEEEGTYSAIHYADDVPAEVKERRLGELMAVQQAISESMQADMVGQTVRVIIDRREGAYYIGRTEFDSPEVDPEVLIPASSRRLYKGHFYSVRITGFTEFDLYGIVV